MEYCFTAAAAGVPVRVHAEHGRDASRSAWPEPASTTSCAATSHRSSTAMCRCRTTCSAGSARSCGIPAAKNAPDQERRRYRPLRTARASGDGRAVGRDDIVIGTVARVQDVKNHASLVDGVRRCCASACRPCATGCACRSSATARCSASIQAQVAASRPAGRRVAARRAHRHRRPAARLHRLRPALAGRRHARVAARSDGLRLAGGVLARGRHPRSGRG